ncbi:hypothetical protein FRC02_012079 [Tulasnella sp. 418]|nr:hypothetical protein FRC02_012079 [Tulasnella sp. 418]
MWLAARSNTNGVEQSHHNVNMDGKGLTLLGGVMVGLQFDSHVIFRHDNVLTNAMPNRYQVTTHFTKAQRSLKSKARNQRKRAQNPSSSLGPSGSPSKKKSRANSPMAKCPDATEHEVPLVNSDPESPMPSTDPAAQAAQTSVQNSRRPEGVSNEPVQHKPSPIQPGNTSRVITSNAPLPSLPPIIVPPGYMLAYTPILVPIPHTYVPAAQDPKKK